MLLLKNLEFSPERSRKGQEGLLSHSRAVAGAQADNVVGGWQERRCDAVERQPCPGSRVALAAGKMWRGGKAEKPGLLSQTLRKS